VLAAAKERGGRALISVVVVTAIDINNVGIITIGIGINTGDVVVGNMGAGRRMDYTCLGDNVNIAARLCDKAAPYQLLLSETAFRDVRERTVSEQLEPIAVKGKKEPLVVYAVTAWTEG